MVTLQQERDAKKDLSEHQRFWLKHLRAAVEAVAEIVNSCQTTHAALANQPRSMSSWSRRREALAHG